ncbi:MAG: hypothetical protein HYV14_10505 [Elusimicrobia bacterium]|nr:hypothetical protein [Elusimicrobiota bacterium]
MRWLTTFALSTLLALPAAAGIAGDQLCRAAGRSSGCIDASWPRDSYRPPRDRDDNGREAPPGCPECRAETIRRLGHFRQLQPPAWSEEDQRREILGSIWRDERRTAAGLGPLLAAKPAVKSPLPAPKKPPVSPIDLIRQKIAERAAAMKGSLLWAQAVVRGVFKKNHNKCNLFVAEMAREGGAVVPNIRGYRNPSPPTAGDWANPAVSIPGWAVVAEPKPGDIIAMSAPISLPGATGHCGVVVGPRRTASANAHADVRGRITVNDWGFREGDTPTFRRYVGE